MTPRKMNSGEASRQRCLLLLILMFPLTGSCLPESWFASEAGEWLSRLRTLVGKGFLPLLSIGLAVNLVLQVHESLRELVSRNSPLSSKELRFAREYHFQKHTSLRFLLPGILDGLSRRFTVFYARQEFRPPHLIFHWFASRGALSLFALPWIKTGFLLLLLVFQFQHCFMSLSSVASHIWCLSGFLLIFWIPSILILICLPYQKCWVSATDQERVVFLRIACVDFFQASRAPGSGHNIHQDISFEQLFE